MVDGDGWASYTVRSTGRITAELGLSSNEQTATLFGAEVARLAEVVLWTSPDKSIWRTRTSSHSGVVDLIDWLYLDNTVSLDRKQQYMLKIKEALT